MAVVFGSPSFVLEKEEKTSQEETKKYKKRTNKTKKGIA